MEPVEKREVDDDDSRIHRQHSLLGALCIVLTIAVIGLAWYAYPQFKRQDASLKDLRDQTRDRIQQVEQKTTSSGEGLRARIDAVGRRAGQAAEDTYKRLEARLDARLDAEAKSRTESLTNLTLRVRDLESSRAADQAQIAELKQQLDQDVAGISNKLAVEKIPFEAGANHTTELTGGITLHVSGTDPAYRRVSGWMWVASEHRDIWLRGQDALEPVIFYGAQDGQKRELVFTNVARNSVTGYLLLPKQASAPAAVTQDSGGE